MKALTLGLFVLSSVSAFAQVNLTAGTSITLSGIQVNCSGAQGATGAAAYLNLPNQRILETLKTLGIGQCKVKVIDRTDFFYSPRYSSGIHLSSNLHPRGAMAFVRGEIERGECD